MVTQLSYGWLTAEIPISNTLVLSVMCFGEVYCDVITRGRLLLGPHLLTTLTIVIKMEVKYRREYSTNHTKSKSHH